MEKKEVSHKNVSFVPHLEEAAILKRVKELGKQITEDYKGKKLTVIGILNGAFVFTADLVRNIDLPDLEVEFVKLSSYTGEKSKEKVTTLLGLKHSIKGKDVLIVEDIVDSGITMKSMLESIKDQGATSIKIACLISKPANHQVKINIDYLGFEFGDKFIIGYGLDFDEFGRHFKDIWIKK